MKTVREQYKRAFTLSIGLHLLVAVLLIVEFTHPAQPKKTSMNAATLGKPQKEIIQAVSLDWQQVQKQMDAIKVARRKKQQALIAKQRKLEKLARLAEQKTARERAKLKALRADTEKLQDEYKKSKASVQKETERRQKELAQLKETTQKAKQDAEALKKLNDAQQQKLAEMKKAAAALQAKKKAEADALKKKQAEQQRIATAQQSQLLHYQSLIVEEIGHHWRVPQGVDRSLACKLQIQLNAKGEVLSVVVLRSSGDPRLDRSAQIAVYKASPLPVPNDPKLFAQFKAFNLTVRPENIISSA